MTNTRVTLTVSRSSHPEFEFYASLQTPGHGQKVCQGSRAQVRDWVEQVYAARDRAAEAGRFVVIDRVDEFVRGDAL